MKKRIIIKYIIPFCISIILVSSLALLNCGASVGTSSNDAILTINGNVLSWTSSYTVSQYVDIYYLPYNAQSGTYSNKWVLYKSIETPDDWTEINNVTNPSKFQIYFDDDTDTPRYSNIVTYGVFDSPYLEYNEEQYTLSWKNVGYQLVYKVQYSVNQQTWVNKQISSINSYLPLDSGYYRIEINGVYSNIIYISPNVIDISGYTMPIDAQTDSTVVTFPSTYQQISVITPMYYVLTHSSLYGVVMILLTMGTMLALVCLFINKSKNA